MSTFVEKCKFTNFNTNSFSLSWSVTRRETDKRWDLEKLLTALCWCHKYFSVF